MLDPELKEAVSVSSDSNRKVQGEKALSRPRTSGKTRDLTRGNQVADEILIGVALRKLVRKHPHPFIRIPS